MSLIAIFQGRTAKAPPARITIRRRLLGRGRRLQTLGTAVGLLSLGLAFGQSARAGVVTWDGTVADWFSNPSHWSGGGYPGTGDDAKNLTTAAMTLGQSTSVQSFFSNGGFSLNGGTFSGSLANAASTLQVNALFTINGGGLYNFTINQGTGGSVVLGNSGANSLDSNIVNADVTLTNDSYVMLYNTNTFNGAINLSTTGNGIQFYNGSSNLVLSSTGKLLGYGNLYNYYGGATVTNNGLINANSAANAITINTTNFSNAGTAEATAAGSVLSLNNTISNTGIFAASGGGTVGIHGSVTSGAASQYNAAGGTILVDGGNLTGTVGSTTGTGLTFSNNGSNNLSAATINGTLTFSDPNAYVMLYNTITENGTINLSTTGNGIQFYNGSSNLVLSSTGKLLGYGNLYNYYGGATVTNNGLINANSSGNVLRFNITSGNTINDTGATLEATNGGVLDLNNTTSNSGTIKAGAGSTVNITGTFNSGTGNLIDAAAGTVNVNGANLVGDINGTAGTTLNFSNSGNNYIDQGTAVGTNLSLNTDTTFNADAYVLLYNTVTNNKTIHFNSTSNGIQFYNASTNLINNGSIVGQGNLYNFYGGNTFTNNGLVNANVNSAAIKFNITSGNTINNTGATLEATNGGVLDLNNTTSNSGTIKAGAGSTVNITGTFNSGTGNLIDAAAGTVNVNGANLVGDINGTAGTTLNFSNSGNNYIDQGTAVGTNLSLNTDTTFNADAYVLLYNTVTNNKTIHFNSTSNGIQFYNSDTHFTNNGSIIGQGNLYNFYGGETFTNNGLVNANVNGAAIGFNLTSSTTTNNAGGTLEATGGGILNLNNTTSNSGTIKATAGSTVNITGAFDSSAGSLIDAATGTVNVNAITLTGDVTGTAGTTLNFGNSSNNNINGATLNTDLTFNNDAYVLLYNTVTENNAIHLDTTTNGIQFYNSSSNLVLGNTGSLIGSGSLFNFYGGGTLTNNGTVNANSAGNTLNLNQTNFSNAGTTEVQNGATLSVTSAVTDTGTVDVKSGGTATFTQGLTQTAGNLTGGGTVNANVAVSGGTVSPGDAIGTLAINGNFTQTGGALDIAFNDSTHDLLTVSGLATTGGLLDVSYLGSNPQFTVGDTFAFLDYGTVGTSITGTAFTQFFSNEIPLTDTTGTIVGSNGFTYELLNNTAASELELTVLTAGTSPVPEASSALSLGAMLALGLGGLAVRRIKRVAH